METLGVGTRNATPLSLPFRSGKTNATALAAPVEVGTILTAAARARRGAAAHAALWLGDGHRLRAHAGATGDVREARGLAGRHRCRLCDL